MIRESDWRPLGSGFQAPVGALRDLQLYTHLQNYKAHQAGAYRSLSPEMLKSQVSGNAYWFSEKVDGEQWFLYKGDAGTLLLAPNGRAIRGQITEEAAASLKDWTGLVAGELCVAEEDRPSTVFALHAALGGGASANDDRLRFRAFDLLHDGSDDAARQPFSERVKRLEHLLGRTQLARPVTCQESSDPCDIEEAYRTILARGGEGLVIRSAHGTPFKLKRQWTLDAVVIGYTLSDQGIGDLLLGLLTDDQTSKGKTIQLIGRVDVGFTKSQRQDFAARLDRDVCSSRLPTRNRAGIAYRWVKPSLVVEIRVSDLITVKSDDTPVRRWRMTYDTREGYAPSFKGPAISLRDAVFLRLRSDKTVNHFDAGWKQITQLVPIADEPTDPRTLPASEILRREVYTRKDRDSGTAVKKTVVWKTNKENHDPRFTAFAAMFTDYSAARQEPLQTSLNTASTYEGIMAMADNWLATNVGRGWRCQSRMGVPAQTNQSKLSQAHHQKDPHTLTIAFGRSSSPSFPIVRRRLKALADLGEVNITSDEKGRESWFELHINQQLVPSTRRINNLLGLIQRWKTTEISLDGEVLSTFEAQNMLNRLEEIQACWSKRKKAGPASCRSCALSCDRFRLVPEDKSLARGFDCEPAWYTIGRFDGERVIVAKDQLADQVTWRRNQLLTCCPHYDQQAVDRAITALPDVLEPGKDGFRMIYNMKDEKPAWVWPSGSDFPHSFIDQPYENQCEPGRNDSRSAQTYTQHQNVLSPLPRHKLKSTQYTDVCGQPQAVEAVREFIEIPIRHGAYFEAIGAKPKAGGLLLAGPPGTGKTLLARAVAHECGAHLEVVAGPEILSQWVGESEQQLRAVFERAKANPPSVILIDEIDSIAGDRASGPSHQQSLVAQLLSLLDGLEARKDLYVLATTNRPDAIDPALRRPGRFDRIIQMGLPNQRGRAQIISHHMKPLKLAEGVDRSTLILDLAKKTKGASGAELAYLCELAAMMCVKETLMGKGSTEGMAISQGHFEQAYTRIVLG